MNAPEYAKRSLLSYSREELLEEFRALGLPSYRVGQVWRWIYARKTTRISQMTDLSKVTRALLAERFGAGASEPLAPVDSASTDSDAAQSEPEDSILHTRLVVKSTSNDGSEKLLLETTDGARVECVLLRDDRGHRTACVSTQVGCAMGCAFCCSGLGGFQRNLSTSEILEQLLRLNALLPATERLTHIVVMGTGEPTLNLDALLPALTVATSQDGFDIGNRKATISTVGIPGGIKRLADLKVPYKLAISLHAPNDRIRDQIMPQNRIHPISEVLAAADYFFRSTGRRVTFEYVMLQGINDQLDHALELARLLRNRTAIVNVIPYNPAPELPFKTPSNETVRRFVQTLEDVGVQVKVRFRKGDKINAACGQLRWSMRKRV